MKKIVKGIVIREVYVNDNDRIVHILTDKIGVISAIAKNSRNIKNRLVTSTSLLSYSEFSLYKRKDMYIIDNADTIKCFHKLRDNIESISLAMYFCQIADFALNDYDDEKFIRLILNSLYIIEENRMSLEQIKFIYEMKFMCFSGYTPDFSGCGVCGEDNEEVFYFDLLSGNLKCVKCKPKIINTHIIELNVTLLKSIIHVITSDLKQVFSFKIKESTAKNLSYVSENFLLVHIDKHFGTLDFYKTMKD